MIGSFPLKDVLKLLDDRLHQNNTPHYSLVVCGGASLIATGLVIRTTQDVDVVAMLDEKDNPISLAPLPLPLLQAAKEVAGIISLPADWLNNGPSQGDGGLFQLGFPQGFYERLTVVHYGECLSVY